MDFDFSADITLENDRVLVRPLTATDLHHLLPLTLGNPDLLQYSPSLIHTEKFLEQYIAEALDNRTNEQRYAFAIFDKEAGKYAGSSSFANLSNKNQKLEIGWTWLGKLFQRTGLNRNLKLVMLQYVFETLEFERVEFRIDERNAQSRKAVEAIGARYEATLREDTLMPDGFRRSTTYYSILKAEWPAVKQAIPLH